MQRILKYHLLLRELLSHTSISHEEYQHVQQAYETMLDVAGENVYHIILKFRESLWHISFVHFLHIAKTAVFILLFHSNLFGILV